MIATESDPAQVQRAQARGSNAASNHFGRRGLWDLAIGLAGVIYLEMVLFTNLSSPAFGITLIVLAGYELFVPGRVRRR